MNPISPVPLTNDQLVEFCQAAVNPKVSVQECVSWLGRQLVSHNDPEFQQIRKAIDLLFKSKEQGWAACAEDVSKFKKSLPLEADRVRTVLHCVGMAAFFKNSSVDEKESILRNWLQEASNGLGINANFFIHLTPEAQLTFLRELFITIIRDTEEGEFFVPAQQPLVDLLFKFWSAYYPLMQQVQPGYTVHELRPGQLDPYIQVLLRFPTRIWRELTVPQKNLAANWIHRYQYHFEEIKPLFENKKIIQFPSLKAHTEDPHCYLFHFLKEVGNIYALGALIEARDPKGALYPLPPNYPQLLNEAAFAHMNIELGPKLVGSEIRFCTEKLPDYTRTSILTLIMIEMVYKERSFNLFGSLLFLFQQFVIRENLVQKDHFNKLIDKLVKLVARQTGIEQTWIPFQLLKKLLALPQAPNLELLRAINRGYPDLEELNALPPQLQIKLKNHFLSLPSEIQADLPKLRDWLALAQPHPPPDATPVAKRRRGKGVT